MPEHVRPKKMSEQILEEAENLSAPPEAEQHVRPKKMSEQILEEAENVSGSPDQVEGCEGSPTEKGKIPKLDDAARPTPHRDASGSKEPPPQGGDPAPPGEARHDKKPIEPVAIEPVEGEEDKSFEFIKKLGEGGMGNVWKVWSGKSQLHYALKILNTPTGADAVGNEVLSHAITTEMRTIMGLRNQERLCPIYELYTGRFGNGLVMMFLEGKTLSAWIKENSGRLHETLPRRWTLFREIVRGVAYLHGHGLVHLDLKPANIFLETRDTDEGFMPVLVDFTGMTLFNHRKNKKLPVEGTLTYGAPEQFFFTADHLDQKCDVYALGVIAYELFGGTSIPKKLGDQKKVIQEEFSGKEAMAHYATGQKWVTDRNPPHQNLGVLPKLMNDLILNMVDPDPERRSPNDAGALDRALDEMERRCPQPWTRVAFPNGSGLFPASERIALPAGVIN
ncbi:MAG: serine/threonine protein kinase [Magnetococcales bacterium]|nr:serine/threonine protein kinase [Magnetococcales bacterium]MBF0321621.1 serine/threonine protein kinase [Magnetococcales bacterium]